MANGTASPNVLFPPLGTVLPERVPNQNALLALAFTTTYTQPFDYSMESINQRADLSTVAGRCADVNSIELHLQDIVTPADLGHRVDRAVQIHIIVYAAYRMSVVREEIFRNCKDIVSTLVDQTGGPDFWRGCNMMQTIALFRQFFKQDAYSVTCAMLHGIAADSINLDAVFNGQNEFEIDVGLDAGAFVPVIILQLWFQHLFEEICEMVGRGDIYRPHLGMSGDTAEYMTNAFYHLRSIFPGKYSVPIDIADFALHPSCMPI